jgi:iron complex outermembrane receptor protein
MTKHNRSAPLMLASASIMALAALPTFASAQTAEAEKASDEGLEIIIVQARKVNENLQDVPVAAKKTLTIRRSVK